MESDERLIQLANQGNVRAFETLYYRYRDWVYRLAWRFTGNRDQALDVLQETFLYLLKKLPELKLTARMTTFLYPVIKHLSLNIQKKEKTKNYNDQNLDELVGPASEDQEGSQAELMKVLAILPQKQRQVVIMRFVDDMKLDEIAQILNMPLNSVKSNLYRALQTLRAHPLTRAYFFES